MLRHPYHCGWWMLVTCWQPLWMVPTPQGQHPQMCTHMHTLCFVLGSTEMETTTHTNTVVEGELRSTCWQVACEYAGPKPACGVSTFGNTTPIKCFKPFLAMRVFLYGRNGKGSTKNERRP